MFCKKCGAELSDSAAMCPFCGEPAKDRVENGREKKQEGKWVLGRTITSALSIILSIFVSVQSFLVGLGNTLTQSGESSGLSGLFVAVIMFTAALTGLITRKSEKGAPPVAVCALFWFCFFIARIGAGSYSDLKFWGLLDYFFGCIFLFSAMRTRKQYVISAIVAVIYLVLGLL